MDLKKILASACAALLLAATGCAHRASVEAATKDAEEAKKIAPTIASNSTQEEATEREALLGVWTSGSCGHRAYLRRIELRADGRFAARDAVAPCPQGARCAWSGVIDWAGGWSVEEGIIPLEIDSGQRLPDRVPDRFIVMNGETLRIAEQTGDVVCPYRRES